MTRTPPLIHIDANVPIYAAGREHPLKAPCQELVRLAAAAPQAFTTDAEVLQELLHYYRAAGNWAQGQAVFRGFQDLLDARIPKSRQKFALTRLHKYVGAEKGHEPITVLAAKHTGVLGKR